MKIFKLLSFTILSISFLLSCQDFNQDQIKPMDNTIEARRNSGQNIVNLYAHFVTTRTPIVRGNSGQNIVNLNAHFATSRIPTMETGDYSGDSDFFNKQESPVDDQEVVEQGIMGQFPSASGAGVTKTTAGPF